MSLYDTLGVAKGASKDEVRRAYRREAKRAHPDAPEGSTEKFHRVQKAMRVLTDDRARERYDRTGSADDLEPDLLETKALQTAFTTVCEVLQTIDNRGGHPSEYDVLGDAKRKMQQQIAEFRGRLENNKREAVRARRMAKSFKGRRGKRSRLEAMFIARAIDIERSFFAIEGDIALAEQVIEILKDEVFSYESERQSDRLEQIPNLGSGIASGRYFR